MSFGAFRLCCFVDVMFVASVQQPTPTSNPLTINHYNIPISI